MAANAFFGSQNVCHGNICNRLCAVQMTAKCVLDVGDMAKALGIEVLHHLSQKIWEEQIPDDRKKAIIIPIYKNRTAWTATTTAA